MPKGWVGVVAPISTYPGPPLDTTVRAAGSLRRQPPGKDARIVVQREELFDQAKGLADDRVTPRMDIDERIDVFEMAVMELLDIQIMKPPLGRVATSASGGPPRSSGRWLMGDDPRLPKMPPKPTLMDFFKLRLMNDTVGGNHLLQSAKLARDRGCAEPIVLACLLHDISVVALVRTDHGHWAAQMIAPYVDPEVTWAVKHHQALRFRPDPNYGYEYPAAYLRAFGDDYQPPAHIRAEWDYCTSHKWFDAAMQVVINDLYAFDPNVRVDIDEFTAIIDRNFRQPEAGLGFDGSPSSHMWRTLIWPNNYL